MAKDTVWVDVEIKRQTDLAWCVNDGKRDVWLPKSAIVDSEDDLEVGAHTKIEIPTSLAEDKGLV